MADRSGSGQRGPIRDQALLDALEKVPRQAYGGTVWRSVRQGRDPLACWRSGGRWDDGSFDVLYTSETRDTAVEERRFHLYQGQPIPPSRVLLGKHSLNNSPSAQGAPGEARPIGGVSAANCREIEKMVLPMSLEPKARSLRLSAILIAALCPLLAGCDTISWTETARAWSRSLCDEYGAVSCSDTWDGGPQEAGRR